MDTINDFGFKQRKYMPVFPKANGKTTVYIEGYPCEDNEPMAATYFHVYRLTLLMTNSHDILLSMTRYTSVLTGFIYYREGDITKFVAPDIYVVLGVAKSRTP